MAKNAKQSDPQNEQDRIPDEDEWHANHEWKDVDQRCEGRQCTHDFSIDLF